MTPFYFLTGSPPLSTASCRGEPSCVSQQEPRTQPTPRSPWSGKGPPTPRAPPPPPGNRTRRGSEHPPRPPSLSPEEGKADPSETDTPDQHVSAGASPADGPPGSSAASPLVPLAPPRGVCMCREHRLGGCSRLAGGADGSSLDGAGGEVTSRPSCNPLFSGRQPSDRRRDVWVPDACREQHRPRV